MNPLLALGQIIVSIALIVADPAAGARHRPVRHLRRRFRRLPEPAWRRAPAVAVHDRAARPVRHLLAGVVHPRARHRPPDGAPRRDAAATPRTERHDPDRHVRGRDPRRAARARRGPHRRPGPPAVRRDRTARAAPGGSRSGAGDAAVRRGRRRPPRLGHAAHRADPGRPRPRRAALLRPRPQRPGRHARARPRRALVGRQRRGATWTFDLRADARWHDGEPVTADDVVFTIRDAPGSRVRRSGGDLVERGHGHGRRDRTA